MSLPAKHNGGAERNSHQRADAAIALRLAGASYSEVAAALGFVNATRAKDAVEKSLASRVSVETREHQRALSARRLERLLRGVWRKATDEKDPEQITAVRTCLAIIDRHARLYGLDAPAQIEVYTPAQAEIEAWVTQVTSSLNVVEEADIIEGEIIAQIE